MLFRGSDVFPQNTLVAHRAWSSDIGNIAPSGWIHPKTARVGLARLGGNTYLYNSTLLSLTGRMEWSINLKPILYPVQKITASKSFTWVPSSKTTPVLVKLVTLGLITTPPVMMRWGRSSLTIGCWPLIGCLGRNANVSWSNLSFTVLVKRYTRIGIGIRDANLLLICWSKGSPPFPIRDNTHAPRRVLRNTCEVWRLSSTAMSPPEFPIPAQERKKPVLLKKELLL